MSTTHSTTVPAECNSTGPFWLDDPDTVTEPSWCDTPHRDTDHPDDRRHTSELLLEFTPALLEPVRSKFPNTDGRHEIYEVALVVEITQEYREIAPQIGLHTDMTENGPGFDFTVTEAEKLGRALLAAVKIARGGAR